MQLHHRVFNIDSMVTCREMQSKLVAIRQFVYHLANQNQDANLKGFCASVNPRFEGKIPDFKGKFNIF